MLEISTEAVVLDKEDRDEKDARVFLYTRDLGLVTAKVTSAKKITSKLNPHLEPLNLVKVRLAQTNQQSNNYQLTDVLRQDRLHFNFLPILNLIKELTSQGEPDYSLWAVLQILISRRQPYTKPILSVLGFDAQYGICESCGQRPDCFHLRQMRFYCKNCLNTELCSNFCTPLL